jgi:hypothetical protein
MPGDPDYEEALVAIERNEHVDGYPAGGAVATAVAT